jgi:L-alanine-DL-glutamate epimerase-like enolase superfamily enzyme
VSIAEIEVYHVTLDYREPMKIAPKVTAETHNIIVKILTDHEVTGWGESSPSQRVTGETAQTVTETLDKIGPNLIGTDPLRIEQSAEFMDSLVEGNPAAKACIDIAQHDILGKTAHKPLFMLLGGYRTQVLTDITLGIKPPKEMAKDAITAVEKGFKALKVKVGVDWIEDVERVRMIREAVGNEIELRVDANQGWTRKQTLDFLKKAKLDIEFLEQPVSAKDIKDLAFIRKRAPIPIMADESVHSPQDALRIILAEAVDLINIKLMKCGGIMKARQIAALAEAAGIPCMIGCMGESELGIAAGVHFAAAVKNVQYADLDSDLLLKTRLAEKGRIEIKNSMRIIPKSDGLGVVDLNPKLLGKPVRVYH